MICMEGTRALTQRLVFFFYALVFKEKPGPAATNFIKNLGFIFVGLTAAKLLSLFFQIYTGRVLGIVEYGKFAFVLSLSQFFWVPMMAGMGTAMVKYLASEKSDDERKRILSTSIFLIASMTAISSVILFAFSPQIAQLTNVTTTYVLAGILVALFNTVQIGTQKVYQGLGKMKKISYTQAGLNIIMSALLVLILLTVKDAAGPVTALVAGYALVSLLVLPELRRYLRPCFDARWARTIIKYGFVIVLGTLCFAVSENVNKIFLAIFLSLREVGLYQAYQFSTMSIAQFVVTAIVTVFFPLAAKRDDKKAVLSKVNRLLKMSPVFFVLLMAISSAIFLLYGSGYVFMLPLMSLFVLASVMEFAFIIYTWFSSSIGIRGVWITTTSTATVSVFAIVMGYLLIPIAGLYGAAVSTLVPYSIGTLVAFFRVKSLVREIS